MPSKSIEEVEIPAVDIILDAYNQADVGKYAEALATIKAAKSIDPRNIYVIALEKQFAKLLSLPGGAATEEARATLPSLLDRALDSARKNHGGTTGGAVQGKTSEEQEQKEARLKEVRDQYFSRADEFVERGDYKSALAEVRRVTIIDPTNKIARQYEEKIAQLAGLSPSTETVETKKDSTPSKEAVSHQASPESRSRSPLPQGREAAQAEKKGKSKIGLLVAVVGVLALAAAAFFIFKPAPQGQGEATVTQAAPRLEPSQGAPQTESAPTPQDPGSAVPEPPSVSVNSPEAKTEAQPAKTESAPAQTKQQTQAPSTNQTQSKPLASASAPVSTPAAKPPDPAPAKPFVAVEKEPKIVKLEKPEPPEVASRSGLTGKVIVKVQIDEQGKPTQAVILTSTNHVFDECVIKAVMRSAFEPGRMSTGPVTTWMAIPFVFK